MLTDALADPDGERVGEQLARLCRAYSDIYSGMVASRARPSALRPYVVPVRDATGEPTPVFWERYAQIARAGFRIGLWLDNEPSVRHGHGRYLTPPARDRDEFYRQERLAVNKRYLAAILRGCRERGLPEPYFIAPILEPLDKRARRHEEELVNHGRGLGYTNWWLMTSPRYSWRDPKRKVLSAPSTANYEQWRRSKADVRSADGDKTIVNNAEVRRRVRSPGPMGAIIWCKEAIGGEGGPGRVESWMTEGVSPYGPGRGRAEK